MDVGNRTLLNEFFLLGLSTDPQWKLTLFGIFLILYLITLSGNMSLVILIHIDSCLHTPMYFFIGNLSFLDFWYTSVYTPKILATCVSEDKHMSLAGFFSCVVAYTECYLLAAMAYDRHMAICNPLLYSSSMSPSLCTRLVAGSYIRIYTKLAQSSLTLCDPVDRSTPGFPVLHHLLEFAQTYLHWAGDAIQPSHPLSSPLT